MNLTPFLLFDGNCAEAMSFYQSCLGGDLAVTKLADTPMKSQMPPQLHNRVAYAQLKGGQIDFSAKDWMHATQKPRQGNTVAMYLNGGQYQELRVIFDQTNRALMGFPSNVSSPSNVPTPFSKLPMTGGPISCESRPSNHQIAHVRDLGSYPRMPSAR